MFVSLRACLGTCSVVAFALALLIPAEKSAAQFRSPFRKLSSIESLACQIDKLEKHVDAYGTVVAKAPDVWGEARLTQHRRDFEKELAKELTKFAPTINAAISRSDQAFLASAFALQAAASGPGAVRTMPAGDQTVTTTKIDIPQPTDLTKTGLSTIDTVIKRSDATNAKFFGFAGEKDGVALEPTIKLDQLKRYLDHLNEIRRIDQGDDTADSPGYVLNLVRIPVSVLPGDRTRQGYGAEISITAVPHLSEELLPQVFQRWVINDLVDELTLPIIKLAEGQAWDVEANETRLKDQIEEKTEHLQELLDGSPRLVAWLKEQRGSAALAHSSGGNETIVADRIRSSFTGAMRQRKSSYELKQQDEEAIQGLAEFLSLSKDLQTASGLLSKAFQSFHSPSRARLARYSVPASIRHRVYGVKYVFSRNTGEFTRDTLPVMQKGYPKIDGADQIERSTRDCQFNRLIPAARALATFHGQQQTGEHLHYPDAAAFLKEELKGAWDFLSLPEHAELWTYCPEIYHAIRGGKDALLDGLMKRFEMFIQTHDVANRTAREGRHSYRLVEDLAWCILVESALVNQSLVEDMKQVARDRNCPCVLADEHMQFYLPSPLLPLESTAAFHEYIRCRWPIKVFAIDPVMQDQNVADRFSLRREMQLSLSLAFASGRMNAQNFTQFARRIELDMETIALNRTVVGFSHGESTFGWRFYPRVQSPEIDSNIKAFLDTALFGGPSRDCLLRQHRLEPGIRECVALVIMPGFVPYVTFDTRSNWFKLTDPNAKQFCLQQTVSLSHDIQELHNAREACIKDAELYRQGEVHRLFRSVEQLEARLPLQTSYVQMPIEDNVGGFQVLASGATNLGPELLGFYGAPGFVKQKAAPVAASGNTPAKPPESTALFLVGNNFSVHETQVVAGGRVLRTREESDKPVQVYLLSRQIVRIEIPGDAATVLARDDQGKIIGEFVDVHVATPYGVSGHIHVPAFDPEKPAVPPHANDRPSAAIDKALWDHVGGHHARSYEWKDLPPLACVITHDGMTVRELAYKGPAIGEGRVRLVRSIAAPVQLTGGTEVPSDDSAKVNIAFWADVEFEGVPPASYKRKAIGPFTVSVDGKTTVKLEALREPLRTQILGQLNPEYKVKKIVLTGYVRDVARADLPVTKIENTLSFDVEWKEDTQDEDRVAPTSLRAPLSVPPMLR